MKNNDELNALKEEMNNVNKKLSELTEEELSEVVGGFKEPNTQENYDLWDTLLKDISQAVNQLKNSGVRMTPQSLDKIALIEEMIHSCDTALQQKNGILLNRYSHDLSSALGGFSYDSGTQSLYKRLRALLRG